MKINVTLPSQGASFASTQFWTSAVQECQDQPAGLRCRQCLEDPGFGLEGDVNQTLAKLLDREMTRELDYEVHQRQFKFLIVIGIALAWFFIGGFAGMFLSRAFPAFARACRSVYTSLALAVIGVSSLIILLGYAIIIWQNELAFLKPPKIETGRSMSEVGLHAGPGWMAMNLPVRYFNPTPLHILVPRWKFSFWMSDCIDRRSEKYHFGRVEVSALDLTPRANSTFCVEGAFLEQDQVGLVAAQRCLWSGKPDPNHWTFVDTNVYAFGTVKLKSFGGIQFDLRASCNIPLLMAKRICDILQMEAPWGALLVHCPQNSWFRRRRPQTSSDGQTSSNTVEIMLTAFLEGLQRYHASHGPVCKDINLRLYGPRMRAFVASYIWLISAGGVAAALYGGGAKIRRQVLSPNVEAQREPAGNSAFELAYIAGSPTQCRA